MLAESELEYANEDDFQQLGSGNNIIIIDF